MLHDSMDEQHGGDERADPQQQQQQQQHLGGRAFESHARDRDRGRPEAAGPKRAPPGSVRALEAELDSTLQPPDDAAGLEVRALRCVGRPA